MSKKIRTVKILAEETIYSDGTRKFHLESSHSPRMELYGLLKLSEKALDQYFTQHPAEPKVEFPKKLKSKKP